MIRVLFQGDSITDGSRDRQNPEHLGAGYAKFVAGTLDYEQPGVYEFINRGIAGNRIVDVYARIKKDIINLKPDVMSLLIGVNDVWQEFTRQNGVDAQKYEMIYELLLSEIRAALPELKIIILGSYVENGARIIEEGFDYAALRKGVEQRAAIAKKIAEKYSYPFVDLQAKFDAALERGPMERFTKDGIHPVTGGAELIKRAWLEAFEQLGLS